MRDQRWKIKMWKKTKLELSVLDPKKLEFMDVEECKKVLKAAGVDPRKYDFW